MSKEQKYTFALFRLIGWLGLLGLILVIFAVQVSWKFTQFKELVGGLILLLYLGWFVKLSYAFVIAAFGFIFEFWKILRGH